MISFQFHQDLAVPPLLTDLQRDLPSLFEEEASVTDGFSFYSQAPTETAWWFSREVKASILKAAECLGIFGTAPDGSLFAVWKSPRGGCPVVCLGSEGGAHVLAEDFSAFLQLLAIGYNSLESAGTYDEPPEEGSASPVLCAWLERQGLKVPPTGEWIVSTAARMHADFYGWCEDVTSGMDVLASAVTTSPLHERPYQPPANLWEHLTEVIGKSVDSPEVKSLLDRVGARPLVATNPRDPDTYFCLPAMGMEIRASCDLTHRRYWPARREGRVYATHVCRIRVTRDYPDTLPTLDDWPWDSVTEHGRSWTAPDGGLKLEQDIEDGMVVCARLLLPQERDHITVSGAYEAEKPLVYVEDAFFATWCAVNGLLNPAKFSEDVVAPWRLRSKTPLDFLHDPCGGLLWSGDIQREFDSFITAYFHSYCENEEMTWRSDIKQVFGSRNHFRELDEAMTPNDWPTYDTIAPRISMRFAEWRAGKLKRMEW